MSPELRRAGLEAMALFVEMLKAEPTSGGSERLTTKQAAVALGCCESKVRQLVRSKQLKAFRVGRKWVVESDEIEKLRRRGGA